MTRAIFQPGTLWELVRKTSDQALRRGILEPIPTEFERLEDGGVQFLLRIVRQLQRKERARQTAAAAPQGNPFLPYDPDLYVADAGPQHVCLLNRFNVLDYHLLIVTRQFEAQESALALDDFVALARCMAEYDSLGFYNGGTAAGASQPHKHLQLVPLPLAPDGPPIPMQPPLVQALQQRGPATARLPFAHRLVAMDNQRPDEPQQAGQEMKTKYDSLIEAVFDQPPAAGADTLLPPYNLLVTRQWMLLVPRRCESFMGISLNALAFAGALLVRHQAQLAALKQHGPMAALCHVAGWVEAG